MGTRPAEARGGQADANPPAANYSRPSLDELATHGDPAQRLASLDKGLRSADR